MPPAPDYDRSTIATTLAALPDPLSTALTTHLEARALSVDRDATTFLTTSRRLKRAGLLARLTRTGDPDDEHLTAVVIGARDLLVATHGEKRGTAVLSARLEDIDVGSLADRLHATGIEVADEGVTLTGFPSSVDGHATRGSFFAGLGPPDGEQARAALAEAVRAAKAA